MKRIALFALTLCLTAVSLRAGTADEDWSKLEATERQLLMDRQATMEQRKEGLVKLEAEVDAFIKNHPDDRRAWEAKLTKVFIGLNRDQIETGKIPPGKYEQALQEVAKSDKATNPVRAAASFYLIQLHAEELIAKPAPEKLAAFDKELAAFSAAYPNDAANRQLTPIRFEVYEKTDAAKALELYKSLLNDPNPYIAAEAKRRITNQELKSKPLDLKFTAVDGTEFDLAKLRGKVVLVDFWATWCGPCRVTIPELVRVYDNHKGKGFEIVGISLDSNKEKLLEYTKAQGMKWPQYFDGLGWENKFSTAYGITGIPTMWLIDKKGLIRSTEAFQDLEGQVAKLLAE